MAHCAGGQECDTFDRFGAIDDWVDRGKAPEWLIALRVGKARFVRSRPLRAYPWVARHGAKGDTREAANFACKKE
jgi:feruloyl esterase